MNHTIITGAQWGDEGKGKIVDLLTEKMDATVRFQGGNNAGHTLVIDDQKIVLHLIPSGILRENNQCFIAQGVVVNIEALIKEIENLAAIGVDVQNRLKISANCPLILDSHIALDCARENQADKSSDESNEYSSATKIGTKIGTTCKGIGPAYEDRAARRSVKLGELFASDSKEKILDLVAYHNFLLKQYHGADEVDGDAIFEKTAHS